MKRKLVNFALLVLMVLIQIQPTIASGTCSASGGCVSPPGSCSVASNNCDSGYVPEASGSFCLDECGCTAQYCNSCTCVPEFTPLTALLALSVTMGGVYLYSKYKKKN